MKKKHNKIKRSINFSFFKKNKNKKWFYEIKDRVRAIELANEGLTLEKIAQLLERSTMWVKKWIRRFNERGEEGLYSLKATGQPQKLPPGSRGEVIILEMLQNGPPAEGALSRYRVKDFQAALAEEKIFVSEFAIRAKLKKLRMSYKTNRPVHEKNDPLKMEEWKENLPKFVESVKKKIENEGKIVTVFFQDEARFGQKGYLTRSWSLIGQRSRQVKQNKFTSGYMITAASPVTGQHFSHVTSCIDTSVMNGFLLDFSKTLDPNVHAIMILDQAGWHRSKNLEIPNNITLHCLPPYSPELNPIENLWQFIKSNFLSARTYKNINDILDKGCLALKTLTENLIKKICYKSWIHEIEAI